VGQESGRTVLVLDGFSAKDFKLRKIRIALAEPAGSGSAGKFMIELLARLLRVVDYAAKSATAIPISDTRTLSPL